MITELTAEHFIKKLYTYLPEEQMPSKRNIKAKDDEEFLGVPLAAVFSLAKEFAFMPSDEIEKLLEGSVYEVKVGGYLADKPRDILYKLAGSKNPMERRTIEIKDSKRLDQGYITILLPLPTQ